jgi:3'(2'), 5'-bisphosphate nucleotidase
LQVEQNIYGLLNPIIEIAKKASFEVLKIYNGGSFGITEKEDGSPLTAADTLASKIICEGISKINNYPIISEENVEIPFAIRSKYNYFWLIDPIDGTKEFIKKNGEFTINIALIEKDEAVLGIVLAPVKNELYYAVKGCGAYFEKKGRVCKLQCGHFKIGDEGLRIPISMSYLNKETEDYIDNFKNHIKIARGAALKFMMIANNEADLYPRLAPTMEWDTAAPQIIIEEAGGQLINVETNERMKYNKVSLENPSFITLSTLYK